VVVRRSSFLAAALALLVAAGVADVASAHRGKTKRHRRQHRIQQQAQAQAAQAAALAEAVPTGATQQGVPGSGIDHHDLKGVHSHEAKQFAAGPPSQLVTDNFEVLGHVNLGGGSPNGDVWFFDHGGSVGKYAYVGSWSSPCSGAGVKIIDVNDPSHPKVVARAGGRTGVSNEDVVVIEIGARDVLGIGVQLCKPQGGTGGLQLFDVTDPSNPQPLSFHPAPAGGVHELDMVTRSDGKTLALLAVPFVEFDNTYFGANAGGEFRIVDITNPASPSEYGDGWGVIADSTLKNWGGGGQEVSSSFQGLGYFAAHYAHSVRAADGGMTAYVSYWDSAVLKFNISNPASPVLVARTQYGPEDDGDGHSMTPYQPGGTRFIVQNDEDLDPLAPTIVTSSATGVTQYSGIEEPWAPTLLSEQGTVSGTVHDANDGCQSTDFTGAAGKIALVDTWDPFYVGIIPGWSLPCTIGSQVIRAAEADARGVLFNLKSPDDAWPFFDGDPRAIQDAAEGMALVMVADIDGLAAAIRGPASPDTVTLDPGDPSFGYIRVFSEASSADVNADGTPEYTEVGEFPGADDVASLPHVRGELFPPPGSWTVHNTEVLGNRAYSSWYSHGIVAINMSNPTDPDFVGQFVPPTNDRFAVSLGHGPAEVWGVAIDPETGIIYASDMRTGLWIVRPMGPAAA
jgi:hypothetical protein